MKKTRFNPLTGKVEYISEGKPGKAGSEGIPGIRGPRGYKGDTGKAGRTGDRGLIGPPGLPGDGGPKGDQGPKGDRGEPAPIRAGGVVFKTKGKPSNEIGDRGDFVFNELSEIWYKDSEWKFFRYFGGGGGGGQTTAGGSSVSFPITAAQGGTGITSYAIGDLIYASGATALSKLADVATGNVLLSGGVGVAPAWGKIGLATHVSGLLGLANGGTNNGGPFSSGGIFYFDGTEYANGDTLYFDNGQYLFGIGPGATGADAQIYADDTIGSTAQVSRVNYSADGYAYGFHTPGDLYVGGFVRSRLWIGTAGPDDTSSSFVNVARTGNSEERLGFFESKSASQRPEFTLANSANGSWTFNFLTFAVHGTTYPDVNYLSESNAGMAMVLAQGSEITKLAIGTYNPVPIKFFTNNTVAMTIDSSGNVLASNITTSSIASEIASASIDMDNRIIYNGANSAVINFDSTLSLLGAPTAPTPSAGDNSTKIATTAFVQAALATFDAKQQVAYASTSALPSNTYSNGSSGVGATLTGTANGPLIIDGVTILVGQVGSRVLVAGEATSARNGWYSITQQGVVAVSPYILTRVTDSDQGDEIGSGYITSVIAPNGVTAGSANNGKVFISVAAADPFVVGTTNLTFSQVGSTYSAGTGLSLSGNTFSIDTATTVDKTTVQTLTNKTLTAAALGSSTATTQSAGDNSTKVATTAYVDSITSRGYTLSAYHAALNPTDGTTYYWGCKPSVSPVTAAGDSNAVTRIYIPRAGTIKAIAIGYEIPVTVGSNENITYSIVLNGTTVTTITSTGQLTALNGVNANYSMSVAVAQGDYVEFKMVCPTWATNPIGVFQTASIYIE